MEISPEEISEINQAIENAYFFSLSIDVVKQYQGLTNRLVQSKLTKELEKMNRWLSEYINKELKGDGSDNAE